MADAASDAREQVGYLKRLTEIILKYELQNFKKNLNSNSIGDVQAQNKNEQGADFKEVFDFYDKDREDVDYKDFMDFEKYGETGYLEAILNPNIEKEDVETIVNKALSDDFDPKMKDVILFSALRDSSSVSYHYIKENDELIEKLKEGLDLTSDTPIYAESLSNMIDAKNTELNPQEAKREIDILHNSLESKLKEAEKRLEDLKNLNTEGMSRGYVAHTKHEINKTLNKINYIKAQIDTNLELAHTLTHDIAKEEKEASLNGFDKNQLRIVDKVKLELARQKNALYNDIVKMKNSFKFAEIKLDEVLSRSKSVRALVGVGKVLSHVPLRLQNGYDSFIKNSFYRAKGLYEDIQLESINKKKVAFELGLKDAKKSKNEFMKDYYTNKINELEKKRTEIESSIEGIAKKRNDVMGDINFRKSKMERAKELSKWTSISPKSLHADMGELFYKRKLSKQLKSINSMKELEKKSEEIRKSFNEIYNGKGDSAFDFVMTNLKSYEKNKDNFKEALKKLSDTLEKDISTVKERAINMSVRDINYDKLISAGVKDEKENFMTAIKEQTQDPARTKVGKDGKEYSVITYKGENYRLDKINENEYDVSVMKVPQNIKSVMGKNAFGSEFLDMSEEEMKKIFDKNNLNYVNVCSINMKEKEIKQSRITEDRSNSMKFKEFEKFIHNSINNKSDMESKTRDFNESAGEER